MTLRIVRKSRVISVVLDISLHVCATLGIMQQMSIAGVIFCPPSLPSLPQRVLIAVSNADSQNCHIVQDLSSSHIVPKQTNDNP